MQKRAVINIRSEMTTREPIKEERCPLLPRHFDEQLKWPMKVDNHRHQENDVRVSMN